MRCHWPLLQRCNLHETQLEQRASSGSKPLMKTLVKEKKNWLKPRVWMSFLLWITMFSACTIMFLRLSARLPKFMDFQIFQLKYMSDIPIAVEWIPNLTLMTHIIYDHMAFSTLFNIPFVGEFPPETTAALGFKSNFCCWNPCNFLLVRSKSGLNPIGCCWKSDCLTIPILVGRNHKCLILEVESPYTQSFAYKKSPWRKRDFTSMRKQLSHWLLPYLIKS